MLSQNLNLQIKTTIEINSNKKTNECLILETWFKFHVCYYLEGGKWFWEGGKKPRN